MVSQFVRAWRIDSARNTQQLTTSVLKCSSSLSSRSTKGSKAARISSCRRFSRAATSTHHDTPKYIPTIPVHCLVVPNGTLWYPLSDCFHILSNYTQRSFAFFSSFTADMIDAVHTKAEQKHARRRNKLISAGSGHNVCLQNQTALLQVSCICICSLCCRTPAGKYLKKTGRRAHPHLFSRSHKSVSSETSGMFSRKKSHADNWH